MTQPRIAVGADHARVEGRLKVTGQARYAADHQVDGSVHAVMVDATVGKGRITGIDARGNADEGIAASPVRWTMDYAFVHATQLVRMCVLPAC